MARKGRKIDAQYAADAAKLRQLKAPRPLRQLVQFTDPPCPEHAVPPLWRARKQPAANNSAGSTETRRRRNERRLAARVPMPLLSKSEKRAAERKFRRPVGNPRYHEWTHARPESWRSRRRLSPQSYRELLDADAARRELEVETIASKLQEIQAEKKMQDRQEQPPDFSHLSPSLSLRPCQTLSGRLDDDDDHDSELRASMCADV